MYLSAMERLGSGAVRAVSRITINSNIASLTAQRRLSDSTKELRGTFERLSSGLRITRAGDDAAGLAVSELLNVDQRVYAQGVRNLNDGVSALSIAGAALKELSSIVIRIRELATQSANGVLGPKQRQALDEEAQELAKEFTRIVKTTEFNGIGLLDGETQEFRFQGGYGQAQTIVSGLGGAMGDGTFSELVSLATEPNHSVASALFDLDADGVLDLVTAGYNGVDHGEITVFGGNGDGTFTRIQTFRIENFEAQDMSLADLNGDGIIDLVTAGDGSAGEAIVFIGNQEGGFTKIQTLHAQPRSFALALGDLNGDGALDLITGGGRTVLGGEATVFLGQGDGTFIEITTFRTEGEDSLALTLGDINSDGVLDLVTSGHDGSGNGEVTVFIGSGSGTFTEVQSFNTDGWLCAASLADLDADGALDLVTAGYGLSGGEAVVFMGNGNGTFSKTETFQTEQSRSMALSLGDLNGDGILDLVTAGYSNFMSGEASIFIGGGDGTFSKSQSLETQPLTSRDLSLGDLNGDGVLDLLTAGYSIGSGEATVFLSNTKNGTSPILPFDLTTKAGALQSMAMLDRKLSSLSTQQGIIGAFEAQLQVELGNLDSARENYIAARSRITDADIAEEAAKLARLQILQNASISVLGQANLQPQIAIQLINGVS